MDITLLEGIWRGMQLHSTEIIWGAGSGDFNTRPIRPRPENEHRDKAFIRDIKGVPWKPYWPIDHSKLLITPRTA